MKLTFTTLFAMLLLSGSLFAQERYTSEVFSDAEIKVTSDVNYAVNATILGLLFDPNIDEFVPEPLFMDVYEPDPGVDSETARPMVLVVHGGDALPRYANNACWGDKIDSVTVSTARKLARMGYVAVAPNYRLGWNPLATTQDAFLDGLVDASVRIQQDLRASVRYLRKNIAEDGNTYGIDSDKFAIWGTSSSAGTYSGFAAYVNTLDEVQTPTYFVTDEDGNVFNTFNEMEAGNLEGTEVGVNALGDTTNYINTPGYSSAFQLAALGSGISLDAGVVDADEPPMIMFGNPLSPVTSVPEGPIQLPTTGQVVAFVQLSRGLVIEANDVGVNAAWADLDDEWTRAQRADPIFGAVEGWLPLYGDPENEYPWVHWDEVNCPVSMQSTDVLPGSNREYALSQIDTMAGYFGVRACVSMGLSCPSVTSTREVLLDNQLVQLAPNPTTGQLTIEAQYGRTIQEVEVHNLEGKLMARFDVNDATFTADNLGLTHGFYTVLVRFEDGVITKKLVVNR
ncbi:MAG: T9SS type A sorting domain-containing protein [Saprospiraceae bacterium]